MITTQQNNKKSLWAFHSDFLNAKCKIQNENSNHLVGVDVLDDPLMQNSNHLVGVDAYENLNPTKERAEDPYLDDP